MSQRVACVTGVTSGIGRALKNRLEQEGWKVVGFARHLPLDEVGYEVDLARLDSVEPVATRAGEEHGPIDAFIHVAGVWHDEDHVLAGKHIEEFTTDEILKTMSVGLSSAMIMTARLLPFISESGTLLYISGSFTDGGANWLPYYTSKRGLEDFVTGLAGEQSSKKVYAVSPSDTASDAFRKYYPEKAETAQSPDAVAAVCLELISDRSTAANGSVVQVRAGQQSPGFHS
jgi:NAD(P)-dependent dehydrogenase (short-subunit alcohol dehydrogenase family)